MLSLSTYIYYKYSSTLLCLPAGSVLVWMKSRVHVYIHLWILSLLYIHIVAFGYIYMGHMYVCIVIVAI